MAIGADDRCVAETDRPLVQVDCRHLMVELGKALAQPSIHLVEAKAECLLRRLAYRYHRDHVFLCRTVSALPSRTPAVPQQPDAEPTFDRPFLHGWISTCLWKRTT